MDRQYEQYSASDVFDALRKVYEQHEKGEPLVWTGPDRLHYAVSATCLNPSALFSQENLDYAAEDQGHDFLDAFMQVCFQVGFHNGVLRGEEYGAPYEKEAEFYREMYRDMKAKFIEASAKNVELREQLHAKQEAPLFHKTRLWVRQYKRTVNLLHAYGERATPWNVAFTWSLAHEDNPSYFLEDSRGQR